MVQLINEEGIRLIDGEELIAFGKTPEEFADDLFENEMHGLAENIVGNDPSIEVDINPYSLREIQEQIKLRQLSDSPTDRSLNAQYREEYY